MSSTIFLDGGGTRTWGGHEAVRCSDDLLQRYRSIIDQRRLSWTEYHRLMRLLGSGGQGVVYLSQRRGTDSFTLPVALKIFSPERYEDERAYDEAMARMAVVAAHVAQIQQDNLLDVHNWVDRNRIRLMEMEWVNGYDLSLLLTQKMLDRVQSRVDARRWKYVNEVIVTQGPVQPRLKPGIAIAIVRDCLAALAALHREGIVHGDMKPSNIMLKRTGDAKIVDIGSAFEVGHVPARRTCTPTYAAPEVLEGGESTPRSDLASLGYVLIEMLAGQAALRRPDQLPRAAGGQAVRGPKTAAPAPRRRGPQRAADDLLPGAGRPRSRCGASPVPRRPSWSRTGPPPSIGNWSRATWPASTTTRSAPGWASCLN